MKPTYVCNYCQATLAPGARWCPRCLKGTGQTRTSIEGARVADAGLTVGSEPATHAGQVVQTSLHLPKTRVRATPTTFGPWMRVLMSLAIVAPVLIAIMLATVATKALGNLVMLLLVPIAIGYGPFAIKLFRGTWRVGRFDGTEPHQEDAPGADGSIT